MNKTPTCRRCSECKGVSHHWDFNGFMFICKHCPIRGDMCEACGGEGASEDDVMCDACKGEGVVARPFELDWRYHEDGIVRAQHPFYVDGDSPLHYEIEDVGDEWIATFEHGDIHSGRLQDCMTVCQDLAREDLVNFNAV